MLIFLLVIVGLSLLILGHELGHFATAKWFGLKIDEFGFGFPPKVFSFRRGETEYSFNLLPFGGFVRIAGENDRISGNLEKLEALPPAEKKRYFLFQPVWKRSLVIAAGVTVNFLLGWMLLSLILMIGIPKALIISEVRPNSAAEQIGLMPGDVIKDYADHASFSEFINLNRGKQIVLNIARRGEDLSLSVVPSVETSQDEGALGVFLIEGGEDRHGLFSAIWNGLKRAVIISGLTFSVLYELVKNLLLHGTLLTGIVGPIGIFSVAQVTGSIGLIYLVQLIALISLNLAVINLIPLPALDGGRLLLILFEKIKGSPISHRTEAAINGLGFAFLILLMIVLTVRDVSNLF